MVLVEEVVVDVVVLVEEVVVDVVVLVEEVVSTWWCSSRRCSSSWT